MSMTHHQCPRPTWPRLGRFGTSGQRDVSLCKLVLDETRGAKRSDRTWDNPKIWKAQEKPSMASLRKPQEGLWSVEVPKTKTMSIYIYSEWITQKATTPRPPQNMCSLEHISQPSPPNLAGESLLWDGFQMFCDFFLMVFFGLPTKCQNGFTWLHSYLLGETWDSKWFEMCLFLSNYNKYHLWLGLQEKNRFLVSWGRKNNSTYQRLLFGWRKVC